jgi:hypothetical protein
MEEDDIIAGGSHPPAQVPVSTAKYDVRSKWVIPTLIPMVLFTSKQPHPGGYDLPTELVDDDPNGGGK